MEGDGQRIGAGERAHGFPLRSQITESFFCFVIFVALVIFGLKSWL
jgi:hypothetical protein